MNLERKFIKNAIRYLEEKGYTVIEHRHGILLLANEKELILVKAGLNPRHDKNWEKVMANKKIQIGIIEPRSDSYGKHIDEPVLKLGYFPEG
jgi:glucosamine 6-phosphate synthetase-like amidotransferase/phosphosugar isomerase protein